MCGLVIDEIIKSSSLQKLAGTGQSTHIHTHQNNGRTGHAEKTDSSTNNNNNNNVPRILGYYLRVSFVPFRHSSIWYRFVLIVNITKLGLNMANKILSIACVCARPRAPFASHLCGVCARCTSIRKKIDDNMYWTCSSQLILLSMRPSNSNQSQRWSSIICIDANGPHPSQIHLYHM